MNASLDNQSRPPCATSTSPPVPCVHLASWCWQGQALLPVLVILVTLPAFAAAAPSAPRPGGVHGLHRRQSGSQSNNTSNGSISMSVWLPILLVTIVFALFSFVTCVRRCAASDAASSASISNRTETTPASGITTRSRRRPRRTPSQISTKSLPPYMKEPGDHELVLFRGPSDMEDDMPPQPMPTLAEDDERPEMRETMFGVALDRVETVDTMPDSSTTHLIHRASASVPRPPELHHAGDRRSRDGHSLDSIGSEAELLATHQRSISVESNADPRGEAPAYTEAVLAEGGMTTISLNDPEPNNGSSNAVVPPEVAGGRRSRFSFLTHNPFSSNENSTSTNANRSSPSIRSESPALHARSGSALSRIPTHESHESHSRTPSGNHNLSRSHSRSNLLRAFRSQSPGLPGGSTISLDSISAPLTHTATRAEFYSPKGGLLTAEQIKLITSREALERFGVPYGPDAVAASRERMGPPPNFESVTAARSENGPRSTSHGEDEDEDLQTARPI